MTIMPEKQTKLVLTLLVFAIASLFCGLEIIDQQVWQTITLAVLGIYAAGNVAATWVHQQGNK